MRVALKIAILESNRTQRILARETGMAESRLSDIVRGWVDPREDEKEALARVLNQPVAVLFGDD